MRASQRFLQVLNSSAILYLSEYERKVCVQDLMPSLASIGPAVSMAAKDGLTKPGILHCCFASSCRA